ncbi:hypothetical protein SAMN05661096_00867 [Marivirga sericea]|uniref:DUF4382 domain-containing protein n=1 Tax=Marivirga sericea TaxID=1028 RepID=A0A1X7INH5_9BACT|nr:hypothetical protein [Marivirga sericea]SMG16561.1 hypothetical protein SAMN05661096_00867 [Marivirga sericea]
MKSISKIVVMLLVVLVFQSCESDTDTLQLETQANVEMRAISSQSPLTNARTIASTPVFTTVTAGVTEIEFETLEEQMGEDEDDDSNEIEFEGRFEVNLLTGESTPDFGLSSILPGVYEEIEIEFDNILDGGHTLIAQFYFADSSSTDTTFVEFTTSEEFELELENDNGFMVDEGTVNSVLVTLDLDVLFGAIDFSSAVVDEDGVIRINEDSNRELANLIVSRIEQAMDADDYDEDDDEDDDDDDDDDDEEEDEDDENDDD